MKGCLRDSPCHRPGEVWGQKTFRERDISGASFGTLGTLGPKAYGIVSLDHSQAGESHVLPLCAEEVLGQSGAHGVTGSRPHCSPSVSSSMAPFIRAGKQLLELGLGQMQTPEPPATHAQQVCGWKVQKDLAQAVGSPRAQPTLG